MTHIEDIWICSECGQEHGRHDVYFDGLCEECNSRILTKEEKDKLDTFRNDFKKEMSLDKVSGGVVIVNPVYISEDEIEIEILWGVQDEENYEGLNKYFITLDRETFEEIL